MYMRVNVGLITLLSGILMWMVFTGQTSSVRAESATTYKAVRLTAPGNLIGGAAEFTRLLNEAAKGGELVELTSDGDGFLAVFKQVRVRKQADDPGKFTMPN